MKAKALVFLFTLRRSQAKLADISGLLLEKGEINLDPMVGEEGEFLHTINGSSPAHESRTITPHGQVLVNSVIPGKLDPGKAPKSTGADAGKNCAPCHVMLVVERGCAGLEHMHGMPAGTVEPGGDQGVHGIAEHGGGRAQISYSDHTGE